MTPVQTVYDSFFSKITAYDEFLELTEEELEADLKQKLASALAKFTNADDIEIINDGKNKFSRQLTMLEVDILAYWMVYEWISPKINNIELLKQTLNTKDYQMYSQANHLKELLNLKNSAQSDAHYWMNKYSVIKVKGKM